MLPVYTPGSPLGLHHILADWLKDRGLPAEVIWREDTATWYISGNSWLTAEIDGPNVIGWQPGFNLHAADPEFFEKFEHIILDAEHDYPQAQGQYPSKLRDQ
jgi:hypothetical protein